MKETYVAEHVAWAAYADYCRDHQDVANWTGDDTSHALWRAWRAAYQERHEATLPFYRRANRMRFMRPA